MTLFVAGLLQGREDVLHLLILGVREVPVGGGSQDSAGEVAPQLLPGAHHEHGGAAELGDLLQEVPQDQHGLLPDEIHSR